MMVYMAVLVHYTVAIMCLSAATGKRILVDAAGCQIRRARVFEWK
jgi:hypothetical protein